ncbi:hypothetical protein QFC21_004721 [Naganishia friedmannii]|uniref:Uncharacterized protein n=1 Tax=Naganishia friedmannii TaxID=89922 RepID=A0ACC2VEU2_9TREE|nr:hypothetical protein QFC21_004721 [Naganishia friedmannii]
MSWWSGQTVRGVPPRLTSKHVISPDHVFLDLMFSRSSSRYDSARSPSWTPSGLAFDYAFSNPYAHPGPRTVQSAVEPDSAQSPTLVNIDAVVGSEILLDARQDDQARNIVVIEKMTDGDGGNALARMPQGSSGFWGLGIDPTAPMNSIITSVKSTQSALNFTVGLDMRAWSSDLNAEAGKIHWGAAPVSAWEGSFNWVKTLGVSPFWAFKVEKFTLHGHDISGKSLMALVDPGYNAIVVPTAVAEQVYSQVKASKVHPEFTNRWVRS